MCAGPYSQSLLGIGNQTSDAILHELKKKEVLLNIRRRMISTRCYYTIPHPNIASPHLIIVSL